MNDGLRLLARFLRRFGYDIKRQHQYNLLPIAGQAELASLASFYNNNVDRAPIKGANLDRLVIYLRICVRADAQKNRPPNFAATSNADLVSGCARSLIKSINHALQHNVASIKLLVLDDHSDPEYRDQIERLFRQCLAETELRTTRSSGQGASLIEQFDLARSENALCYFCEDDYLHVESAIAGMCGFYRQIVERCDTHLVIHPQEHDFLYTRHIYPSYILIGDDRHWRTISHATHTLFMHSSLVSKHWAYFENTRYVGDRKNRRLGVESRTTNHLFELYPGFAPIPAVAAHMQTLQSLPPLFDWQDLWNSNKTDADQ